VEKSGIVSVGDQPIDIPMFAASGLAVAMGNAHPQARMAAQVVAPANDEDGVAWLVAQLLDGRL
jgi:hydroxymethylpyrimidine pyrophosphatase-like HAD family hydrolase